MEQHSESASPSGLMVSLPKVVSLQKLGFLNQHFKSLEDVSTASHLFQSLTTQSAHLDAHLLRLRTKLTNLAFSSITPSFYTKNALHTLLSNLQTLSLNTCKDVIALKKIQHILTDLAQITKQLQRIETIRKYIDTTLRLEALVGDLEDAVFSSLNHPNENIISAKLTNSPISTDFRQKEDKLLKSIKALNDIDELLVVTAQFQPQWHHLLKSVDIRVDKSLVVVRPQVFADYRLLLTSIGWPPELLTSKIGCGDISVIRNPLELMRGDVRECYCQSFLALCALQHLQIQREKRQLNLLYQEREVGLWAVDELVSPIASRIEYHFLKWIEQPEYIFALAYKITRDFIVGVDYVLGPLIDKARLRSYSAKEAWVSAMVQMLLEFLTKRVFPALAERYKEKHLRSEVISTWLHLIDLMVVFDKRMKSLLNSESCLFLKDSEMFEGISRGTSVLMIFYDRPDWLKVWAKVELKDACKKLKADLKDEKAWLIANQCNVDDLRTDENSQQFLLSSREDHRSPVIADSAVKIAWEMIQRCRTFPAILPRYQFIRSTAAKFIWYFLNVLLLRCKRVELLPDCPDDNTLMTICGLINAARYVEFKLQEWSDDVNFLELTASQNDSDSIREDGAAGNCCFFKEEIKGLLELETNWLMEIIAVLLRQFETLSCNYIQNKDCFEQVEEGLTLDGDSFATISVDFVEPLDALSSNLKALNTTLNRKDFMDLWRSVADGLDHFIFRSIFTCKIHFSSKGIDQFRVDMQALFVVFQPFCARPEAFFPCIKEILKLLKMSMEEVKHLQIVTSNGRDLTSYGFSHLSFDQVHKILRNRKL